MHVVNMEEYGHLVNPEEYSTQYLNNDMYELFNNRKVGPIALYPHCTLLATPLLTTPFILTSPQDWESKYIHPNWSGILEEDYSPEMVRVHGVD